MIGEEPHPAYTTPSSPYANYRFAGWESSGGGGFADPTAAQTTFTMPSSDTVVTAKFSAIPVDDGSELRPGDVGAAGSFSDGDMISDWARAATELMQEYGILTGKPGNVADPQGNATRAGACTVVMRLILAVLNR